MNIIDDIAVYHEQGQCIAYLDYKKSGAYDYHLANDYIRNEIIYIISRDLYGIITHELNSIQKDMFDIYTQSFRHGSVYGDETFHKHYQYMLKIEHYISHGTIINDKDLGFGNDRNVDNISHYISHIRTPHDRTYIGKIRVEALCNDIMVNGYVHREHLLSNGKIRIIKCLYGKIIDMLSNLKKIITTCSDTYLHMYYIDCDPLKNKIDKLLERICTGNVFKEEIL